MGCAPVQHEHEGDASPYTMHEAPQRCFHSSASLTCHYCGSSVKPPHLQEEGARVEGLRGLHMSPQCPSTP